MMTAYRGEYDSQRRARTCSYCGRAFKSEDIMINEHFEHCPARKLMLHKCNYQPVKACTVCNRLSRKGRFGPAYRVQHEKEKGE